MRSYLSAHLTYSIALLALGCGPSFALAGEATLSGATIITVEATSGGQSATFAEIVPVDSFTRWGWQLPNAVNISTQDGTTLATIDRLKVSFISDPQVDLEFSFTNPNNSNPVTYDVSTTTLIFSGVYPAEGIAAASITLTQGAGSTPGASLTGLFPNSRAYEARYSTDSITNTHTVFADLLGPMSFSSGQSTSASDMWPADGSMLPISGTCYMMESEFKFELSAGDQASGTSTFLITPEPASMSLLAIGWMLLGARRSSRR